jgi:dihydrodipicolinate synthase/N-acetylneuraminate lyase
LWSLADISPVPVYLYDVPDLTGAPVDVDTYLSVARHPNIRGAQISGRLDVARTLRERVDKNFRIIVAEPHQVDLLLREGMMAHLDGMFALAPRWTIAIGQAALASDWKTAATFQGHLNELRDLLISGGDVFGSFTAMMNQRDIPGAFHAAPFRALDEEKRQELVAAPVMRYLLKSHSGKSAAIERRPRVATTKPSAELADL